MASAALQIEDHRDAVPFFVHSEVDDYPFDPFEFRAYARLCRRAGDTRGEAYESVDNMAEGCRMSARKLRYCLDVLEACGFISCEARKGKPTIIRLLPRKCWANPARYAALRVQALEADPSKNPRALWKPKAPEEGSTPASGAAPPLHDVQPTPAPGAAKGSPLKVLPNKDDDERASRQTPFAEHDMLPTSERRSRAFHGGYELKLLGNTPAQRAFNVVKAASDASVVEAACFLIDDHPAIWDLLSKARANLKPTDWTFCDWAPEIKKDLQHRNAEQVASDLQTAFAKAKTDFLGYYQTVRDNPKVEKPAQNFSRSSRRRERPRDGVGSAEAAAKLEADRRAWRELGVEV